MKYVSAKFVPQLLTCEQKENCLSVVFDLPEHSDTNENLKNKT
jgi:hypothetical protein